MTFTLAALAIACDTSDAPPGEPCTNDATREAIRRENSIDVSRFPDDEASCRLRRALLKPDDVPSDWSHLEPQSHDFATVLNSYECVVPYVGVTAGLRATFLDPNNDGLVIGHSIASFESRSTERFFAALRRSCRLMADASTPGERFFVSLPDFPHFGDDSLAVELQFDPDSALLTRALYVRYGDILSVLTVTVDQSIDLEKFARIVDARIGSVGDVEPNERSLWAPCSITPTALPSDPITNALTDSLIELDDLGVGWVEAPSSPCDSPTSTNCEPFPHGAALKRIDFSGPRETHLSQSASLFDDDQEVTAALQRARVALQSASECEQIYQDLGTINVEFHIVSGEPFGGDVLVWRTAASGPGVSEPDGSPKIGITVAFRDHRLLSAVHAQLGTEQYIPPNDLTAGAPLNSYTLEELTPIIETARRKLAAVQAQLD
jgi:hypothetical protein